MFLFCHFCQHTKGSGCIWVTFFSLAVGSSLTLDFLWFSVKGWTPKSWGSSLFPKMGTTNWWTWLVLLNLLPLPTWNMMIWVCCAILKKQLQTTYTDTYATNLGLFSSFFRGLNFYWKTYIYIWESQAGTVLKLGPCSWWTPRSLVSINIWCLILSRSIGCGERWASKKCIYQLRAHDYNIWYRWLISVANQHRSSPVFVVAFEVKGCSAGEAERIHPRSWPCQDLSALKIPPDAISLQM